MSRARSTIKRVAIGVFVVASVAFFAFAMIDAWKQTNGDIPSIPLLLVAGVVVCAGLLLAAWAWARILGGRWTYHGAGLLVSQLAKYVPGGIWQATGQVGLARNAGIPVSQGATAFTVLAVCQAIAGGVLSILLAFTWSDGSPLMRVLIGVGGAASVVLLDRRWMVWALHKIPRARDASAALVPRQRVIFEVWACYVVELALISVAYVVLLSAFGSVHDIVFVVAAYSAAWTVGFVAVPIPSGVGIREAILLGLLHGTYPSSVIVAASVYQRLVTVASEGIMALVASHRLRSGRAAPQLPDPES